MSHAYRPTPLPGTPAILHACDGCGKHATRTQAAPFQRCPRCRLARFCSPHCADSSWYCWSGGDGGLHHLLCRCFPAVALAPAPPRRGRKRTAAQARLGDKAPPAAPESPAMRHTRHHTRKRKREGARAEARKRARGVSASATPWLALDPASEAWLALEGPARRLALGAMPVDQFAALYERFRSVRGVVDTKRHAFLWNSPQIHPAVRAYMREHQCGLRELFCGWSHPLPQRYNWLLAYALLASLRADADTGRIAPTLSRSLRRHGAWPLLDMLGAIARGGGKKREEGRED